MPARCCVRWAVSYDGGRLAKGSNVTVYYDGTRSVRAVLQRPSRSRVLATGEAEVIRSIDRRYDRRRCPARDASEGNSDHDLTPMALQTVMETRPPWYG